MPIGTNTVIFVAKTAIPQVCKVTYARMVASIGLTKAEVNSVRVTVSRDRLDFPCATTTHCAILTTKKCLLNSTISTPGACFMNLDIKDFYYGTAMARYEFMKLAVAFILDEIIYDYNLRTLSSDGWVYLEIRKGMPGLKQAGRIANDRLKAHLAHFGFSPVTRTRRSGNTPPIPSFSLSLLRTLGSNILAKRTQTTSSKPSKNSTPSPSTGPVPYSADSPSTGTMLPAPATSPCQNIYKKPCSNSNTRRLNAHNTPHTTGQNKSACTIRTRRQLFSSLAYTNNHHSATDCGDATLLFHCNQPNHAH